MVVFCILMNDLNFEVTH